MGDEKRGQPPIIKSPDEFHRLVDEYAAECMKTEQPATFAGLAFRMGFASRQSFYDYEKRDGYSYPVKRARLLIEAGYEARLHGNSPTGAIFALKNHGWSDKTETDMRFPDGIPAARVDWGDDDDG